MRVNEQVKAQTRRALLAAGAQAFAEYGFERANIDRVSEAAGLAKGTVYNYFPSKRAVFETLLLDACRLAAASADAVPDDAPAGERLAAFVAGNLAWARENEALAQMLARELTGGDRRTRAFVLEASAPCVAKVAAILRAARDAGELQLAGPPDALALTFIVLANALLLQATQQGGWPPPAELPQTVSRLFLGGVPALAR